MYYHLVNLIYNKYNQCERIQFNESFQIKYYSRNINISYKKVRRPTAAYF